MAVGIEGMTVANCSEPSVQTKGKGLIFLFALGFGATLLF